MISNVNFGLSNPTSAAGLYNAGSATSSNVTFAGKKEVVDAYKSSSPKTKNVVKSAASLSVFGLMLAIPGPQWLISFPALGYGLFKANQVRKAGKQGQ